MLAIRLQRIGRKKLAHYRLIAQEHHIQPTSGNVVAYLGNFNPHTKEVNLDQEKIEFYLGNGAQPSNSAAKLMQREGIKLPDWVKITQKPDRKKEAPVEEKPPVEEKAEVAETEPEAKEEDEKTAEATADEKEAQPAADDTEATKEAEEPEAAPDTADKK